MTLKRTTKLGLGLLAMVLGFGVFFFITLAGVGHVLGWDKERNQAQANITTVEAKGEVIESYPLLNSGGLWAHRVHATFGGDLIATAPREHLVGETVHVFSAGNIGDDGSGRGYYIMETTSGAAPPPTLSF